MQVSRAWKDRQIPASGRSKMSSADSQNAGRLYKKVLLLQLNYFVMIVLT